MATRRVARRRSHGRMRKRKKPSIVICPASVPVTVELWPEAIRATANAIGAIAEPRSPSSKPCACWISVTSTPWRQNVAAETIRMAALTSIAPLRATAESMRLYLHAWATPSRLRATSRLCTSDECRYRLCGMTVAPRMPMAT